MQHDLTGLPLFDRAAGLPQEEGPALSKTAIAVIEAGIRRRARREAARQREEQRKAQRRQERDLQKMGANVVSLEAVRKEAAAKARSQRLRELRFRMLAEGGRSDDRDKA